MSRILSFGYSVLFLRRASLRYRLGFLWKCSISKNYVFRRCWPPNSCLIFLQRTPWKDVTEIQFHRLSDLQDGMTESDSTFQSSPKSSIFRIGFTSITVISFVSRSHHRCVVIKTPTFFVGFFNFLMFGLLLLFLLKNVFVFPLFDLLVIVH